MNARTATVLAALVVLGLGGAAVWALFMRGSDDDTPQVVSPGPDQPQPEDIPRLPPVEDSPFDIAIAAATAFPVPSKMVRDADGAWTQKIDVPEGATLVTVNVERTEHRAPQAALEVYVLGEYAPLPSLANAHNVLDANDEPRSLTVLGPYSTGGETSIDLVILGAPAQDSLFRVRELSVRRSEKPYAPLANVFNGKYLDDARPQTQALARSLAILYLDGGSCSGFAVSDSLLLTNHHCISRLLQSNGKSFCSGVRIVFRHFKDDPTDPSVAADCKALVAKRRELDYALIRFSPQDANKKVPGLRVATYRQPDSVTDPLFVLQHPWGRPAQITTCEGPPTPVNLADPDQAKLNSVRSEVCRADPSRFITVSTPLTQSVMTYSCNTQPGSSGSPVFQDTNVIALHFAADLRYYQNDGKLSPQQGCLEGNLDLRNWGRNICDVLKDAKITAGAKVTDIPSCPEAPAS